MSLIEVVYVYKTNENDFQKKIDWFCHGDKFPVLCIMSIHKIQNFPKRIFILWIKSS